MECRDDYIGHVLRGNIEQVMKLRTPIAVETILKPPKSGSCLKLVLVEGAPGIGKSTLAWELCRKWEEFSYMKQYKLVILLRLREEEVQAISNVAQLFFSYEGEGKKALVHEILSTNGKGVLFILDGYDELPSSLQKSSFLIRLVQGIVLPECSVLVTSRPAATAKFLTACRPRLDKHIELLGFTQESITAYATSVFTGDTLKKFNTYISASSNPAINSLMYIPLNAAIIVEIFRTSPSKSLLPHTLTELYTQLCLTILNRFLQLEHPSISVFQFNDLPRNLLDHFLKLSDIAFECIENETVIFHSLNPDLIHFGFFDAVTSLYGGGSVSFNFLHLTLQEFFAAYHISQLSEDEACMLVREYSCDTRWSITWRFLAGLTTCKYLRTHIATCSVNYEDQTLFGSVNQVQAFDTTPLLIQCMYEGKVQLDFGLLFKAEKCNAFVDVAYWTPLDAYALGCSICIDAAKLPWSVTFYCSESQTYVFYTLKLDYFLSGMNKSKTEGIIEELITTKCEFDITELKHFPLQGIKVLRLAECKLNDTDLIHLSDLIPHMKCLKTLDIDRNNLFGLGGSSGLANVVTKSFWGACDQISRQSGLIREVFEPTRHDFCDPCTDIQQDGLLRVLRSLIHSKVTSLSMVGTDFCHLVKNSPHGYYSALKSLIDPSSGNLKSISFGDKRSAGDRLMTLVSSPSSLKNLLLRSPSCSLTCLETNTCLTTLKLHVPFLFWALHTPDIIGILKNNIFLQYLILSNFDVTFEKDMENLHGIVTALHENKTLHSLAIILDGNPLYIYVASDYMKTHHNALTHDSRVHWYPEDDILRNFQGPYLGLEGLGY